MEEKICTILIHDHPVLIEVENDYEEISNLLIDNSHCDFIKVNVKDKDVDMTINKHYIKAISNR